MSRVLPILFNTDMVRAILDGRKTVTRRIIKNLPDDIHRIEFNGEVWETLYGLYENSTFYDLYKEIRPPYQPGDILYVRETWQQLWELDGNEEIIEGTEKYYYAATDTVPFDTYVDYMGVTHDKTPWRPSIHMPKEAARIWLKVTNVRVERLRDITNKEAKREGVVVETDNSGITHRVGFAQLWDSTIKKSDLGRYGWDASPWVWVIEFERCEKPIQEGEGT